MKLPSIPQTISLTLTTAAGAAIASFASECPNWQHAATGAGLVFIASVLHLYQRSPVTVPS